MLAAKVLLLTLISVYLVLAERTNGSQLILKSYDKCPDGPQCLDYRKRNARGRILITSFYPTFLDDNVRFEADDSGYEPRVSYEDTEDLSNTVDYDLNANGIGGNSGSGYKNGGVGYKNGGGGYKNDGVGYKNGGVGYKNGGGGYKNDGVGYKNGGVGYKNGGGGYKNDGVGYKNGGVGYKNGGGGYKNGGDGYKNGGGGRGKVYYNGGANSDGYYWIRDTQ